MSRVFRTWSVALIVGAATLNVAAVVQARDRGINPPGAAGNVGVPGTTAIRVSTNPVPPATWVLRA